MNRRLAITVSVALLSGACGIDNPGRPPVANAFHFPITGVISPDGHYLYVVNSDFNLEFNGGSVVTVDLNTVRTAVNGRSSAVVPPPPAAAMGQPAPEATYLVPVTDQNRASGPPAAVRINPFATDAAIRTIRSQTPGQPGRQRLYVTVRGDATLTWIDLEGDGNVLRCGAMRSLDSCDDAHRRGFDATQGGGPRLLTLPPVPFAVSVRDDDPYVAVIHQESPRSRMSLFVDSTTDPNAGPTLIHWVGELNSSLAAVVRLADGSAGEPGALRPQPYWLTFSRDEPLVSHVRAVPDDINGERAFLFRSRVSALPGLTSDVGIRSIVRDPQRPNRYIATARASGVPAGVSPRSGDQLLSVDLSDPQNPIVTDVLALSAGPSRLVAIRDPDPAGPHHTIAYVVSYDARVVQVIDVDAWRAIDSIRTQFGPNTLLADPGIGSDPMGSRDYLYLIDFGSFCIEVIDVGARATRNRVVFTIGDVFRPGGTN